MDSGDLIELTFKGDIPVEWIESPNSDPYFDMSIAPEKVVFIRNKVNKISKEHLLPELLFTLTEEKSFGVDLNVNVTPKHGNWQKDYKVDLHPDGLDVGIPEFSINELTGIVRGREKNRAPSIHINTSQKSILKKVN